MFEEDYTLSAQDALASADALLVSLHKCPIPPPLALSALARPALTHTQQRTAGAYYTDFRLAQHVADLAASHYKPGALVIDPAAGSGILLVAATLAACGSDRHRRSGWLAESIIAWDLSKDALRGARLALAALTDDLSAIRLMFSRWCQRDSLLPSENELGRYDIVLGNPPWEKVKLTRHEFLRANGHSRHYGANYDEFDCTTYDTERLERAEYATGIVQRYPLMGTGEPDLYKAFLELFLRLAKPGACISVLVPAGLIRSQGTEHLRRFLFDNCGTISMSIFENRARFFSIDTRFKFLGLFLTKLAPKAPRSPIQVSHASGTRLGIEHTGRAHIGRHALSSIRPDLTIPEVRSIAEWRMFQTMSQHSIAESSGEASGWLTDIVREVDMTRDRKEFQSSSQNGFLPLVEGRMIHQHRFGSKAYRSGTGRKAIWEVVPWGEQHVGPQFWYPHEALTDSVRERVSSFRAGFCDITGQTNERSMLAALIPPGVVCGNKVPTVTFPEDHTTERVLLWLAIVNSIPFDWALRRIVTTTVNYFVLLSAPFPRVACASLPGRRLIDASQKIHAITTGSQTMDWWRIAALRASIDVTVLALYGLDFGNLEVILDDFPLLDRGQPPIPGESRSTVTKDFLLSTAAERLSPKSTMFAERLAIARQAGAIPYMPSEHAGAYSKASARANHV
jgi:methylase of polypeptide subunit release factors